VPCLFRLTHPHLQLFLFELPLRDGPGGSITLVVRGERSRDWDPAPTGLGAGTARIPVDGLLCVPGDGIISIMQGSLFCFIIFLSLFYFQDIRSSHFVALPGPLGPRSRNAGTPPVSKPSPGFPIPNRTNHQQFRLPSKPLHDSPPFASRLADRLTPPTPSKYPYMP
jgi:hypothetical protein